METSLVNAVTDDDWLEMRRARPDLTGQQLGTLYVTMAPDLRFNVSRRIKEEFENVKHYYVPHGQQADVPDHMTPRPDRTASSWHNEYCFRG